MGENFGGFGTTRKLVEKNFVADHTNNSSLFELTRTYVANICDWIFENLISTHKRHLK